VLGVETGWKTFGTAIGVILLGGTTALLFSFGHRPPAMRPSNMS
jgi:hypothetical protein